MIVIDWIIKHLVADYCKQHKLAIIPNDALAHLLAIEMMMNAMSIITPTSITTMSDLEKELKNIEDNFNGENNG